MALPSTADVNKQLWDETLTKLLDLSTATVKRNSDLENRVAELELELSVWKQAHANILEMSERDKKAHNAQVSTLNRQISSLETIKSQHPLIFCVIDGWYNVFHESFLRQGLQGGLQAAQQTTKGIAEYLAEENVQVFGRISFWITLYLNKRATLDFLLSHAVCTAEQFDDFLLGFSQASPRFQVVEVEHGREAVASKMKETLETFTRFPQTLRVFFTGVPDNAYLPLFADLGREELLGKLVMLPGSDEIAPELQQLAVPSVNMDGLFIRGVGTSPRTRPLLIAPAQNSIPRIGSANSHSTTGGGVPSPESEISSQVARQSLVPQPTVTPGQPIDASKVRLNAPDYGPLTDTSNTLYVALQPLHKQVPPPCNEHYLMSCSKGPGCKYSHDWALTQEQLDVLARNAKKAPCNYLKNGLDCPHGDRCCWGHVCPGGAKCFHLSKGKCWFKGKGMHPEDETFEENI